MAVLLCCSGSENLRLGTQICCKNTEVYSCCLRIRAESRVIMIVLTIVANVLVVYRSMYLSRLLWVFYFRHCLFSPMFEFFFFFLTCRYIEFLDGALQPLDNVL